MKRSCLLLLPLLLACSHVYRPGTDWEQREFDASVRDVYPNDVRADLAKHAHTQVAWVGLITEVHIDEAVEPALMQLAVDHKFFSWTQDGTSFQYWPSPRGEGSFATRWPMQPEWDLDQMRALILPGDMVIVYGVPESVRADGTIELGQARYIRHVPKEYFRTDKVEYGRPGEPVRVLSTF
jgi:hypothetical protein